MGQAISSNIAWAAVGEAISSGTAWSAMSEAISSGTAWSAMSEAISSDVAGATITRRNLVAQNFAYYYVNQTNSCSATERLQVRVLFLKGGYCETDGYPNSRVSSNKVRSNK